MLLEQLESIRLDVVRQIPKERKSKLGQFMTPLTVARFMAALFTPSTHQTCYLLDAGAGIGSLSSAFFDRLASGELCFDKAEVSAYEIDEKLREHLSRTLGKYDGKLPLKVNIIPGDFIEEAANLLQIGQRLGFTHAILNPPYKKINSNSRHRILLRLIEIETVNLYSAFVALAIKLMETSGQVVAIIPRSFCNGPYYRPFRELILRETAIRHIHLFESRKNAFRDDGVLQENIIIKLEKKGIQEDIIVSTSTDDSFNDFIVNRYPFEQIVFQNDPEIFIHVPTYPEQGKIGTCPEICHSLHDIGLAVSTGPIVDFRLKEHLCVIPEAGTVPLLYPCHFAGQSIQWPRTDTRKPNAIQRNEETERWLYPNGYYVVVRRFSSKEERRRIVAKLVYPDAFNAPVLGFENHLNIFHAGKQGISEYLARGLTVFVNSTVVDESFRRFSGHTQVNATDLRLIKYPSREALMWLGKWAKHKAELTQETIDEGLKLIA